MLSAAERRSRMKSFCDNQRSRFGVEPEVGIICEECGRKEYCEPHYERMGRPLWAEMLCSGCHQYRHLTNSTQRDSTQRGGALKVKPVRKLVERGPRKIPLQCPPCVSGCHAKCTLAEHCRCKCRPL